MLQAALSQQLVPNAKSGIGIMQKAGGNGGAVHVASARRTGTGLLGAPSASGPLYGNLRALLLDAVVWINKH